VAVSKTVNIEIALITPGCRYSALGKLDYCDGAIAFRRMGNANRPGSPVRLGADNADVTTEVEQKFRPSSSRLCLDKIPVLNL
jgi:hypothetical protein